MKKSFGILVLSFAFLFSFSTNTYAALFAPSCGLMQTYVIAPPSCVAICNESTKIGPNGTPIPNGLVPCGREIANKTGAPKCPCQLGHFFILAGNIYRFFLVFIATPLAALMITIGGLFYLFAGAKPDFASRGKQILLTTLIGLILTYGAWVAVVFMLNSLGYSMPGGIWPFF